MRSGLLAWKVVSLASPVAEHKMPALCLMDVSDCCKVVPC